MIKGKDKMGFVFFVFCVGFDIEMWEMSFCFILDGGWGGRDIFWINNLFLVCAYSL